MVPDARVKTRSDIDEDDGKTRFGPFGGPSTLKFIIVIMPFFI